MAVKVMIRRKIKEGHLEEAHKLIARARYNAFHQEGYIGSETMTSLEDPNTLVIVSTWQTIDHWETWKNNEYRNDGETGLNDILDGPTAYEAFAMGIQI